MNKQLTFNDKAAIFLTKISGNMKTFWIFIICYVLWIFWNTYAPVNLHFDENGFVLLLSISNFIQLIYMPVLQTGTNLLDKNSGERNHKDYGSIQKEFIELKEILNNQNNKINELYTIIQDFIESK